MGKAKIASASKGATVQQKNDYSGYIRYGYRMPNGLIVTNIGTPIGIGHTGSDSEPILLPHSFIDMVPVALKESVEFSHLGDVFIFAVSEKAKMDFDRVEAIRLIEEAAQQLIQDEERQAEEYLAQQDSLDDAIVAVEIQEIKDDQAQAELDHQSDEEFIKDCAKDNEIQPICGCDMENPDLQYETERALNNKLMEDQIAHEKATGVVDADGNYLPDAGDTN